jgi:hypothetical protein
MEFLKKINKKTYILIAIILIGIFLRTYKFHAWLSFELDQVRDAKLVSAVVQDGAPWPLHGASMRKSGASKDQLFYLGPIYYDFQIISAKIFGNYPDKLAYPDLFFSILTIPLLYFFLKKYFDANIALALSGLWSVSFFALRYARFAWNPNAIPFFVLLFLCSLHEFLKKGAKTHWSWGILLGVALGIGVQLHAILLLLFPAVAAVVFLMLFRKEKKIWKHGLAVLFVFLALNGAQIFSEFKTNFSNTKTFFSSPIKEADAEEGGALLNFARNVDCHVEAGGQILTSLGADDCNFRYLKILASEKNARFAKQLKNPIFQLELFATLAFAIFGLWKLFSNFKKEANSEKKSFLGLLILYLGLSFFVMLPVLNSGLTEYRYFIHVFFLPYLFLGFLIISLQKKLKKIGLLILAAIFIFVIGSNAFAIFDVAKELSQGSRTDYHYVALGEIENMTKYLSSFKNEKNKIYLNGDSEMLSNLFRPWEYLLKKQNVELARSGGEFALAPTGEPYFFLAAKSAKENPKDEVEGLKVETYQEYPNLIIYKIKN